MMGGKFPPYIFLQLGVCYGLLERIVRIKVYQPLPTENVIVSCMRYDKRRGYLPLRSSIRASNQRIMQRFFTQPSRNASCSSVWNQCSPFSRTVRPAPCAAANRSTVWRDTRWSPPA